MKEFFKNNIAIIVAFGLPVLLVIVVTLNLYLPSLFLSTSYNFVYATCTGGDSYHYSCDSYLEQRYAVQDGKLVIRPDVPAQRDSNNDSVPDAQFSAHLFLHDTERNESREIGIEEAQGLLLNGLLTSPDGVTVSNGYERGADFLLFFDGGSSYGHFLTKGKSKSKLNLIRDDLYYYRSNFRFIGWVLPGRS